MKPLHALLAAVLTCSAAGVYAQWQWLDKDGHKVFSDRAPGAEIPEKNILKRPAGAAARAAVAPVAPAAADPAAAPAAPAPVLAASKPTGDKTLEAKKKQAEEAEAAKRKAEDERIARAKADSCSRARQAKASLDSGARVARNGPNGEREVMDDAARATEAQRLQDIINSDCK